MNTGITLGFFNETSIRMADGLEKDYSLEVVKRDMEVRSHIFTYVFFVKKDRYEHFKYSSTHFSHDFIEYILDSLITDEKEELFDCPALKVCVWPSCPSSYRSFRESMREWFRENINFVATEEEKGKDLVKISFSIPMCN